MFKKIILIAGAAVTIAACTKNAISGRNQLSLVSEAQLQQMAKAEYQTFLTQNNVVSTGNKDAEMVRRIGTRIATAVTEYYKDHKMSAELAGYQWEYNLVNNNQVNAWCMPGGKIVVYTGLLPVSQNEAALAVVMGHEIAHALLSHGQERMSQGLMQQLGGVALQVALANKPQQTQNLFMTAYGAGSTIAYTLPHSRSQETEADKYGLRFTALAGYNPREAIGLWQRMKAAGGGGTPQFLSTHPAEDTRIKNLQAMMDETIRDYYKPRN